MSTSRYIKLTVGLAGRPSRHRVRDRAPGRYIEKRARTAQQPAAEADRRPLKRRIVSRSTHHPTTTATEDAREVPLRTPTTYQARPRYYRTGPAKPKSKVQRNAALSHTLNRATRLLPRSMLLGTGSLEISAYGTAASSYHLPGHEVVLVVCWISRACQHIAIYGAGLGAQSIFVRAGISRWRSPPSQMRSNGLR